VARGVERLNEQLARHIVSTVLGVPATRFEDGRANSQVDALVHYPDRVAALEIVADHEAAFNAQSEELERRGRRIEVQGLRQAWMVLLQRRANVRDVQRELPALLLAWQDNPPPDRPRWVRPAEMDRLKVLRAWPMDRSKASGRAYLVPEGFWGFAGDEQTVGAWVTRMMTTHVDVPAKVAAHPDAAERHAFLWATVGSDMGVQIQLEPGGDNPFPVTPPRLPPGVSHVWVAGSARHQGAIAWFPDRGWWRTPWLPPTDEPITLDN
jgi:hypothetical protein